MPIIYRRIIPGNLIHDKQRRAQVVSNFLTRLGKGFKQFTKDNMIIGPATGRLYQLRSLFGATRFHRASARFERPAPDTMNLVNSIKDEKTSDTSVIIYVDDGQAPYGKYLQSPKLEREIMTEKDAVGYLETGPGSIERNKMEQEMITA